jgi:hypothetical protein
MQNKNPYKVCNIKLRGTQTKEGGAVETKEGGAVETDDN